MNSPSKPPPTHAFQNVSKILNPSTTHNCLTCGSFAPEAFASAAGPRCEVCYHVERSLEHYAKAINGRIKLKAAVAKAEEELDRAAKGVK